MPLLREITRFLDRVGMAPATFGRLAANDPRLVFDMRNGRRCGRAMRARLRAFMAGAEGSETCD